VLGFNSSIYSFNFPKRKLKKSGQYTSIIGLFFLLKSVKNISSMVHLFIGSLVLISGHQ